MLKPHAVSLAAELLPHGHREGREWVAPSLVGTSRRSTSLCLFGEKAGVWSDFSEGVGGDLLKLIAVTQTGGELGKAIAWAKAWLGLDGAARSRTTEPQAPEPVSAPRQSGDGGDSAKWAQRIFFNAQAALLETPVLHYLSARGIVLEELGRYPGALRYAPALFNRETGRNLPAMVAAIRGASGPIVAVHRTWLAHEGGLWRKAPLREPDDAGQLRWRLCAALARRLRQAAQRRARRRRGSNRRRN